MAVHESIKIGLDCACKAASKDVFGVKQRLKLGLETNGHSCEEVLVLNLDQTVAG